MDRVMIEFAKQRYSGVGSASLALSAGADDPFTERLRRGRGPELIWRLLLDLTDRGEAIVDAGANVGSVSTPLGLAGRRVLAVEAMAENFVLLLHGIAKNGLTGVVPVHAAVADETGVVQIDGYSAYARVGGGPGGSTPALRLDDLVVAHGFADVAAIKLDVEGSELAALRGMTDLLSAQHLRAVVFEANGAHCHRVGYRPTDLFETFERYGFELYMVKSRQLVGVGSGTFQPFGNVDYLAVRPTAMTRSQRRLTGELTVDDMVAGVVDALRNVNRAYRIFMLGELQHASERVVGHADVRAAIGEHLDSGDAEAAELSKALLSSS